MLNLLVGGLNGLSVVLAVEVDEVSGRALGAKPAEDDGDVGLPGTRLVSGEDGEVGGLVPGGEGAGGEDALVDDEGFYAFGVGADDGVAGVAGVGGEPVGLGVVGESLT